MADIANFENWEFRPNARYRIQLVDGTHVDAYFVSKDGDEEMVWYTFNRPDDEGGVGRTRTMIQNFIHMPHGGIELVAPHIIDINHRDQRLLVASKPTLTENTHMGNIEHFRPLQSRTAFYREADVDAATSYLALLNASRLPAKGLTTSDLLRKLDRGEILPNVDGQAPPSRKQLLTKNYVSKRPYSVPTSRFSGLDPESKERVMNCLKPKSGPKRRDQPEQGPSECVLSGGTRKKRRKTCKSRRRR